MFCFFQRDIPTMPVLAMQKQSGTCVLLCLELYQVGIEICWVICVGFASFHEWCIHVHVAFELHVRLHCVSDDIVNNYELQNARREAVSRWLSSTASDKIKKEIQEAKYKVWLFFVWIDKMLCMSCTFMWLIQVFCLSCAIITFHCRERITCLLCLLTWQVDR